MRVSYSSITDRITWHTPEPRKKPPMRWHVQAWCHITKPDGRKIETKTDRISLKQPAPIAALAGHCADVWQEQFKDYGAEVGDTVAYFYIAYAER